MGVVQLASIRSVLADHSDHTLTANGRLNYTYSTCIHVLVVWSLYRYMYMFDPTRGSSFFFRKVITVGVLFV